MSTRDITDELVNEAAALLSARFALDDDGVRELGARLADDKRRLENLAFSERFVAAHPDTFDRLSR